MSLYLADLPTLVIAGGATASQAIAGFGDAEAVSVFASEILTNAHLQINVHTNSAAATATVGWATLTSGGANVILQANKMVVITDVPWGALRLSGTDSEGAARVIRVQKQFLL